MKDLFSKQAKLYAQFRPTYPKVLYKYILHFVKNRTHAWDCATGNGQVAKVLANKFERVSATDLSKTQLAQATPKKNITYIKCKAEETPFNAEQFDLITVGQALHWFDFDQFFNQVRKVAKPDAILAVWGYKLLQIDPVVDKILHVFYEETLGEYWAPQRKHVDAGYRTIPFPFGVVYQADFEQELEWDLEQLIGYLSSWSAVQTYIQKKKSNPLKKLKRELEAVWGEVPNKKVVFPIFLKLAKIEDFLSQEKD